MTPTEPSSASCRIETFELGPYQTNCYLVYEDGAPAGRECWIVDAGFDPGEMRARIEELQLKPSLLILTHAHADHLAGVNEMLARFAGCRLFIHGAEEAWLGDPRLNLSGGFGLPITTRPPDRLLVDGDVLELGQLRWQVLHTPGHSPGGITLYCPQAGAALVGDTLFAGSIGRTDFDGGDFQTLASSIRSKLYVLPPATRIFPGHGPASTVGQEKLSNPFVRG